jgi:hypothetical protein
MSMSIDEHVKGRTGNLAEGFTRVRSDEREVRWCDESGRVVQRSRWDEGPISLTRDRVNRIFEAYTVRFHRIGFPHFTVSVRRTGVAQP